MSNETPLPRKSRTPDEQMARIRIDLSKGFAAVKVMMDERFGKIEDLVKQVHELRNQNNDLTTKIAVLEERFSTTRTLREVTGQFKTEVLESRLEDLKDDRTHKTEKVKATAGIWIAVVTGICALLASTLSMILQQCGGGHP